MLFTFCFVVLFLASVRSQCSPAAARTSDSLIPNNPGVQPFPSTIPATSQPISLGTTWEWHREDWNAAKDNFPGHPLNVNGNTLTMDKGPGAPVWQAWNGSVFPTTANNQKLFELWNTYDHGTVWYKLSLKFHQSSANRDTTDSLPSVRVKAFIFSKSRLVTINAAEPQDRQYPNTPGALWVNGPFGICKWNRTNGCLKPTLEPILRADSVSAGHTYARNYHKHVVGISFKPTQATTPTNMEAVFRFSSATNVQPCVDCMVAFRVEMVGHPHWSVKSVWTIGDPVFERLSTATDTLGTPQASTSEIVSVLKMASLSSVESSGIYPRTDCPHLQNNLKFWDDPSTWGSGGVPSSGSNTKITLPANTKVLIRSCSLSSSFASPYARIEIPSGSELIFDDQDIDIYTTEIFVQRGGKLSVGGQTCRMFSKIRFFFVGSRTVSSIVHDDMSKPSKGIISEGETNIMGKQYHPTWTRLSLTAYQGDNKLHLQDAVNWEVGQEIVVVTSTFRDAPDDHENERVLITGIDNTRKIVGINKRLRFPHYAGREYQAEVILLTRRIRFEGSESGDKFGGHSEIRGSSIGRLSGIEAVKMGQQNVLARYPFHFHVNQDSPHSHMSDCSIHESFFRCMTIHGTNNLTLSRNVAFNISGHCFYIEDGVEENNLLEYNAAVHIHPIGHPASGNIHGEEICSGCDSGWSRISSEEKRYVFSTGDLVLPADVAASGFYVSNAFNKFVGNVASGGWSGFAFINLAKPLGVFAGQDRKSKNPWNRPTDNFNGNTAHSSGFYWSGVGSCIYAGGQLFIDGTTKKYHYKTGRIAHPTLIADKVDGWMILNNTKTYLCTLGINHWGERSGFDKFEAHDVQRSIFMIGENFIHRALINGKSGNTHGASKITWKTGFMFYDTFVKQFLDDVTFRNYNGHEPIIKFLVFSMRFLPQGIAATRNIKFENCPNLGYRLYTDQCGHLCDARDRKFEPAGRDNETQAQRIMAMYDFDGSASGQGRPTLVGSTRLFWNYRADCVYDTNTFLWYCPYDGKHEIAFLDIDMLGVTDGWRHDTKGLRYDDNWYPSHAGYVSMWGPKNFSMPFASFPGIAGPTATGWYLRPFGGAPKSFTIGGRGMQVPRKHFVVVAMKYPAATIFHVKLSLGWGKHNWTIPRVSYDKVTQLTEPLLPTDQYVCSQVDGRSWDWTAMCETTGGVGPAWYFDGKFLYLRVVNPFFYNKHGYKQKLSWGVNGMKLWSIVGGYVYYVETTCAGCKDSPKNSQLWDVVDELPFNFTGQVLKDPPANYNGWKAVVDIPSGNSGPNKNFTGGTPAPTASNGVGVNRSRIIGWGFLISFVVVLVF